MSKKTRNHLHFLELHSLLMREIHFIIFNFILFNNNNYGIIIRADSEKSIIFI